MLVQVVHHKNIATHPRQSEFARLDLSGWVDDVAIQRAINGQRTRLTPAETRQAVHTLTNQGKSIRWIATQLGITTRTVQRHRAALNIQENAA